MESKNNYWQDLSYSKKIEHLFEIACFVDCKFLVGPDEETAEIIQGHRLMFIMASPVFEKMLTGEYDEANKNSVIRINDANPHDFKNFRYLIYQNHLELSCYNVDEITQIHILCDKYLVSSIGKQCIIKLKGLLTNSKPDETIKIYKYAFGMVNNSFLNDITKTLQSKEILPNSKLCDLSKNEFYEYIKIKSHNSTVQTLYSTVNFYLTQLTLEADHLTETLNESELSTDSTEENYEIFRSGLIKLINFNFMSPVEFIKGPGISSFLTNEEKYGILSKMVEKYFLNRCY